MLSFLRKLYFKSPLFLQKVVFLMPKTVLFGKTYKYFYRLLRTGSISSDRRKQTLDLVKDQLLDFSTPYTSFEDFWFSLPFMDKNQRFKYSRDSVSKSFSVDTGGVTGTPANFKQNNEVWFKEMAYVEYLFESLGLGRNEIKLSFRGGEFGLTKDDIWYSNPLHREICFSPFQIQKESIQIYKRVLSKYRPAIWYGYPSAFKSFFSLLESESVSLNFEPRVLLLISESFTKNDIDFFKKHLPKTRITAFYGLSERCVFGFPTEGDISGYKIDTDYSYVELVDANGNVITENGVLGEIVATTYDNSVMPLIRYRTGDYTSWIDFSNKTIGLIEGKWNGVSLVDINGNKVSLTAINFHIGDLRNVEQVQFNQVAPGLVAVSLNGVSHTERRDILAALNKRVGGLISFIQNPTNDFVKTNRGKVPLLVLDKTLSSLDNATKST